MKEINSLKEIEKICEETFLMYYKQHDGNHCLKSVHLSDSPTVTLTVDDVITYDGQSSLDMDISPFKYVYNEIYVHYDKDPATGDYKGLKFVKQPDQSVYSGNYHNLTSAGETYWDYCRASQVKYGTVVTKHFYLDRIVTAAVAELFIKFAISWFYLQKNLVFFDTHLSNCNLEVGDTVTLAATIKAGDYMIYSVKENLGTDIISLKMRQL
jgi:hypothetical protein